MYYGPSENIVLSIFYVVIPLLPLICLVYVNFSKLKLRKDIRVFITFASAIVFFVLILHKSYMAFAHLHISLYGREEFIYKGSISKVESGNTYQIFYLEDLNTRFKFKLNHGDLCYKKDWKELMQKGIEVKFSRINLFFEGKCIVNLLEVKN